MRKLSAILLLSIYLLMQVVPVCCYLCKPISHAWFSMLQLRNLEDHRKNELFVVTVDKGRIEELENEEGEIVIGGILYDIEKTITKGNRIEIYLEKDEGETNWKAHYSKLNQLLHKQTNSKAAGTTKAQAIFVALFYARQITNDGFFCKGPGINYNLLAEKKYRAPWPGMVSPPPRYS